MGISINTPGSVSNQASMTGTLSIRKSTNTFEQMTGVKSSGGTSKKQLNYNHRDISGQLLRAKKPQSASAAALFCIPATVQTDGLDRCPRFLRRYEVCYMEAHFVMG